jgi:hypothetical protein
LGIVANGLFTNERAKKFLPGSGGCGYCNAGMESIPHLFFKCPFAQKVWQQTAGFYGAPANNNLVTNSSNFVEILDHCLRTKAENTARATILYETAFMLWKAQNQQVFQGKDRSFSIQQVANLAKLHALALLNFSKSAKKKKRLTKALNFIQFHIDRNKGN